MTGLKTRKGTPILGRSATAEEIKKRDGWQIGTVYRVDPKTGRLPESSPAKASETVKDQAKK